MSRYFILRRCRRSQDECNAVGGVCWESAGEYDFNLAVRTSVAGLQRINGQPSLEHLHIGEITGNMLATRPSELDHIADGLVSGPPCTPFSVAGLRMCDGDSRSNVFIAVTHFIIRLSTHGNLSWCRIEHVCGTDTKRSQAGAGSFTTWVVSSLRESLPHGWRDDVIRRNAAGCGMVQSRPRLSVRGLAAQLHAHPFCRRALSTHIPASRPCLFEVLARLPQPAQDLASLIVCQHMDVIEYRNMFIQELDHRIPKPVCATVYRSRAPTRNTLGPAFGCTLVFGAIATLRNHNACLWVLTSPEHDHDFSECGRKLSRVEKCRGSGMGTDSLRHLSEHEFHTAIGSTIPTGLIGHILAPVCQIWNYAGKHNT